MVRAHKIVIFFRNGIHYYTGVALCRDPPSCHLDGYKVHFGRNIT